jgi:hypothetical protein
MIGQTSDVAMEKKVPPIYGRYKGADWFDLLYRRDIMILGQGGIGSWLSLLLSRTGAKLYLYDMDRFEDHNGGQLMFRYNVGQLKTEAIERTIVDFSPDCPLELFGRYTAESETAPIVLSAFDNNESRKLSFNKWAHFVSKTAEPERRFCFFQDGRLLAEQFMIFNIPGDRPDLMEKYRTEYLYGDEEVEDPVCTFKQTPHMAAGIAVKMEVFLTNWITNASTNLPRRAVPFMEEYFAALNLTMHK